MRHNIKKSNSTKAERIIIELLKKHRINFEHRVRVEGLEIDFLIDKYAIEIDGHAQDPERNKKIVNLGYIPIHFTNQEVYRFRGRIGEYLKSINVRF